MSAPRCELAPSVLSFDLGDLRGPVTTMMEAGADRIHFDVMDGQFVPPITFGAALVGGLRDLGRAPFEAHLMTLTPERHFEAFAAAGCARIYFHAEATAHAHYHAQRLRSMGVQPGLAINPGTPVEAALPCLGVLDAVLVMTVNPGWGGQALIAEAFDKVRRLRTLAPDLDIEVDGGIDAVTLPIARAAGANHFVVGSHLARQPSLADAVRELRSLCG